MKTIEQLYEEIMASDELKKQLAEVLQQDKEAAEAWVKAQGCDADFSEIKAFLEELGRDSMEKGELTPEQLEQAAGGSAVAIGVTLIVSVFTGYVAMDAAMDRKCI